LDDSIKRSSDGMSEQETTSNSSTSEDGKGNNLNSLMNGKNRNSSGKSSPVKQNSSPQQQQQNRCTWCAETKQPLKYVLPTQNGKKEFCSETCIAEFRKAYNKGACKECDNAIRGGNAPNRDFCSTYCLNKNSKKKAGQQTSTSTTPSTSQTRTINNNNNTSTENNNNSKQKSSSATIVETNNNNTLMKEHYAMTKISPMFQYEAFHVFDWKEYLKVSS
jgi:polycomb protein SCMH1